MSLRRRWFTKNGVLMEGTTTGVWMNGMMKEVVLDGMETTNGCVAELQVHFHKKAQKEWMRTWTQELELTHS